MLDYYKKKKVIFNYESINEFLQKLIRGSAEFLWNLKTLKMLNEKLIDVCLSSVCEKTVQGINGKRFSTEK